MNLAMWVLMGLVLGGCVSSPDPWWKAIETANNKQCLEYVKRLSCRDFLKQNEQIRPTLVRMKEVPENEIDWLLTSMIEDIDKDARTLNTLPECQKEHP